MNKALLVVFVLCAAFVASVAAFHHNGAHRQVSNCPLHGYFGPSDTLAAKIAANCGNY